ncbi:hypothetical protein [Mucilaginibacter sp. HD30]
MHFSIHKNLRYSLIFAFTFLMGCESAPIKTGIWKDKDIPADKAEKLRQLNTDFFKAINTDRNDAEILCSKELLEQKNIIVQLDHVKKLRSEKEYTLLKDYYVVNKGGFDDNVLKMIEHPEINYVPLAKEMYLAFFIPKDTKNKVMLTLVYAKYDIGWKVNNIAVGYYTQQGKTATELFEIAKKDYAHGYLVNAINNIVLATNCLSGSAYLKAANGEEIKGFAKKIIDEANSKITYPVVLNNIKSKPAIFTISSDSKEDRFVQYVYYITTLKLADTAALRKENDQVKQQLPKVFPGIDKGNKIMFYSAMREKPKVGESIGHADFEEKINN